MAEAPTTLTSPPPPASSSKHNKLPAKQCPTRTRSTQQCARQAWRDPEATSAKLLSRSRVCRSMPHACVDRSLNPTKKNMLRARLPRPQQGTGGSVTAAGDWPTGVGIGHRQNPAPSKIRPSPAKKKGQTKCPSPKPTRRMRIHVVPPALCQCCRGAANAEHGSCA